MNIKIFILYFLISFISFSQGNETKEIFINTGLNRVGHSIQTSFQFGLKNHRINVGLKTYLQNHFFEKQILGYSIGYAYFFEGKNDKMYFSPTLNSSWFRENKTISLTYLTEVVLTNKIGFFVGKKLSLFAQTGMGIILHKTETPFLNNLTHIQYPTYEISLGISYHINR